MSQVHVELSYFNRALHRALQRGLPPTENLSVNGTRFVARLRHLAGAPGRNTSDTEGTTTRDSGAPAQPVVTTCNSFRHLQASVARNARSRSGRSGQS
jgi:hypothetical protein